MSDQLVTLSGLESGMSSQGGDIRLGDEPGQMVKQTVPAARFSRRRIAVAAACTVLVAVAGLSGVGFAGEAGAPPSATTTAAPAVKLIAGRPRASDRPADSTASSSVSIGAKHGAGVVTTTAATNATGRSVPAVTARPTDTPTNPSVQLTGGRSAEVASTTHPIDLSDASIPPGTGQAIFQTEHWTEGPALGYSVPAPAGPVQVQLYFAENYAPAQAVGARLMDVSINGVNVEHNLDVFKQVGAFKGLVRTYTVQSAGRVAVSLTNPTNRNSPHLMALEVNDLIFVGPTTQPPTTQPPTTQPPTTQPPASSIILSPGADVASAVAAAPAGSSFYLQNGTYQVGAIQPKTGDTITGQSRDGTILDGAMTRPNAFAGTAANVTLSAMTIQHYVPARLYAAIDGTQSTNWTMTNLHVTNNNEEGLAVGPGSLVDNILADHNGNVGIGTGNVNNDPHGQPFANLIFTVQNSELSYNGAQDSADAAGAKVLFTNGATFTNNYVHNNYGFGLWTDAYNTNTVYQNNHVTNNQAGGIFHEISYAAIIRNNVISGNAIGYCTGQTYFCGTGGISISDSHDVQIYGNTLTANHDSIVGYNGHSSTTLLYNLQVHDNIMTDTAGTTGIQTWPYVANAYTTSHWTNNTYQTGQNFYWNGNLIDITAFHNAGQS